MRCTKENDRLPLAREEELVVEECDGEVLVHDLRTHKTHCLNVPAALIWRHCDGRTTSSEMAAVLERELGEGNEELVQFGLERLSRSSLLTEQRVSPLSRRQMLTRAAILVPVVVSITAPGRAGGSMVTSEECFNDTAPCSALPCSNAGPGDLCLQQVAQNEGMQTCLCQPPIMD